MDMLFYRWFLRVSDCAYQLFLVAYPSRFRHIYGADMAQVFRDCCRDAYQQGGVIEMAMLWIGVLYDLVVNATGEHISTLVQNIEEKRVSRALLAGGQGQAVFMISSQQFPEVRMFRLLDCPCTARRIGEPPGF